MGATTPLLSRVWLLRLRWAGGLGVVSALALGGQPGAAAGVAALGVAGHGLLGRAGASEAALAAVMLGDVGLLTGVLLRWPGDATALTALYAFPVLLGALTLRSAWAWGVFVASIAAYAGLHVLAPPNLHHHTPDAMRAHLLGMFGAYVAVAAVTVFVAGRVRAAQAEVQAQLEAARAVEERNGRLAALATLAAGAAHELATPLSTILLVSRELGRSAPDEPTRQDLTLIAEEVGRCQEVLAQLTADSGAGMGEAPRRVQLRALVEDALRGPEPVCIVATDGEARVPERLVSQVLRRLVGNARDACPGSPPQVRAAVEGGRLVLEVRDAGPGLPAEALVRAGEPFYTTRPGGRGLGVFFVRSVAERLGGAFTLRNHPEGGAVARVELPVEAT